MQGFARWRIRRGPSRPEAGGIHPAIPDSPVKEWRTQKHALGDFYELHSEL